MADIETTLRAMEERCEAATPPPWGFTVDSKTHKPAWLYSGHEGEESDLAEFEEWDGHYADQMQANVDFIVASRTDIPRLIAAVRVLLNGIETIGLLGVPKGSPAHRELDAVEPSFRTFGIRTTHRRQRNHWNGV
jgi:hypothetical protein